MKTEKLTFHHTQTSSETALLKIITTRILNLPRIIIWVFFTVCLLTCLILTVNDANSVYAVPLVIFAGLLSCCSLGLLILPSFPVPVCFKISLTEMVFPSPSPFSRIPGCFSALISRRKWEIINVLLVNIGFWIPIFSISVLPLNTAPTEMN